MRRRYVQRTQSHVRKRPETKLCLICLSFSAEQMSNHNDEISFPLFSSLSFALRNIHFLPKTQNETESEMINKWTPLSACLDNDTYRGAVVAERNRLANVLVCVCSWWCAIRALCIKWIFVFVYCAIPNQIPQITASHSCGPTKN